MMADERPPIARDRSTEASQRRRGRSWAILVVLLGLAALFYAITIVKMTHH